MMKIYRFLEQVLVIFAVTILFVSVFARLFGEGNQEYSSFFQLGSQGMAFSTIKQFLFIAIVITAINRIFLSERFFGKLLFLWRMVMMVGIIVVVMVIFIISFQWFPKGDFLPWIFFLVSFLVFFLASIIVMAVKSKAEEQRYKVLLEAYWEKEELKEEGKE